MQSESSTFNCRQKWPFYYSKHRKDLQDLDYEDDINEILLTQATSGLS